MLLGYRTHPSIAANWHLFSQARNRYLATVGQSKKTTAQFIAKAMTVHKKIYDYSLVIYSGSRVKVEIGCQKHGPFMQEASNHLAGNGCPRCATASRSTGNTHTTEQFIAKARALHGERYNYSRVIYRGNRSPVLIGCSEHGLFSQVPLDHLLKSGCQVCAERSRRQTSKVTNAGFISKARAVHGDRYDYKQVEYAGCLQKIKIVCSTHGFFEQAPHSHLQGVGCPKCAHERISVARRDTTESFIHKAQTVHGNRYDYSQLTYRATKVNVAIICSSHGLFEQWPVSHLQGSGCSQCGFELISAQRRRSWVELAEGREGILYLLKVFNNHEVFFKVGITFHSVHARYNCKRRLGRYSYELIASYKSTNVAAIYDWEQSIIETFAHVRYLPKGRFCGETECFSDETEILACFPM